MYQHSHVFGHVGRVVCVLFGTANFGTTSKLALSFKEIALLLVFTPKLLVGAQIARGRAFVGSDVALDAQRPHLARQERERFQDRPVDRATVLGAFLFYSEGLQYACGAIYAIAVSEFGKSPSLDQNCESIHAPACH